MHTIRPSNLLRFIFIYLWERDREQAGEGQRERETESQAGSMPSAQSLMWALNPWTMRSWPEPKLRVGCLTNWATLAPHFNHISIHSFIHSFIHESMQVSKGQRQRERERIPPGAERECTSWSVIKAHLMQGLSSRTVRSWPQLKSEA